MRALLTCVLEDGQDHVFQDGRVAFTLIQARIVRVDGVQLKLHVVGVVVGRYPFLEPSRVLLNQLAI